MEPYLLEQFGNPSAIHTEGRLARQAVEHARSTIARTIEVRPEFVTFTSGGTEANNIAIMGHVQALARAGRPYEHMTIVTTRLEHPSVLRVCDALAAQGVQVRYVPVSSTGRIKLDALQTMVDDTTVLLATSYANSEIGTIQPTRPIAKILKKQASADAIFVLDCAQAPLWLRCQFASLGVDIATFDFGKCQGPKGVGALVHNPARTLLPTTYGGGQERDLRPGTESVAAIVGAAVAFKEAQANYKERAAQVAHVRNQFVEMLLQQIDEVVLNGAPLKSGDRIANNINISIPGLDTEFLTVVLDTAGFAVSTKSACSGAGGGQSAVVLETSGDAARAASTLRITLGPDTTLAELEKLTIALHAHVEKMKMY
jgi:cysteine desulfurase